MITTRNRHKYDGGIRTIKDRAAHLVQALEGCPLEFTLRVLADYDRYNSPGTKSRSARRWIREFCGFESEASRKAMDPIIDVLIDGYEVRDKGSLNELMKDMPDVAQSN